MEVDYDRDILPYQTDEPEYPEEEPDPDLYELEDFPEDW